MKTFLFFPECLEDAKISIIGAPYDLNSSRRYGSRFAPDVVRAESRDMETVCDGLELSDLPVEDLGDLRWRPWRFFSADLRKSVDKIVEKGSIPVIIGGDHSITPEIIKAIKKTDIHIVSIDAHLDFDLELYGNTRNHSCSRRREADIVGGKNITIIGLRSWPSVSMEDARKEGVTTISAYEVREEGIDSVLERLPKGETYLTVDIDGIDPAYAPGTGTPEPFGLLPSHVMDIIHELSHRIVGMDVVEICPPCDVNGITSILGAKIIMGFIRSFFSE